jgi:hypothetical protein
MNKLVLAAVTAAVAAATTAYGAGISGSGSTSSVQQGQLLLIGPVDAVNAQAGLVTILGQKLTYGHAGKLVVGDTAAVFGVTKANGSFVATSIVDQGRYVPGATVIFLTGKVQKSDSAVGRVTVDGLTVDLTGTMSNGVIAPAVGSKLQITGTQPTAGGLVVASGISGSGDGASLGISGSGASLGISGSGASLGISGSGTSKSLGISGSGASLGISGSGASLGISGSGTSKSLGISGSGASLGISGSGASLGISGSG